MIGKLQVDGFAHLNRDPSNTFYDQGKVFIEDLLTQDYSFIGNTYFGLPKGEDILKEIGEEYD